MPSATDAAAYADAARDLAADALAALHDGGGRLVAATVAERAALGVALARLLDAAREARLVHAAETDGRGACEDAERRRADGAERLAETAGRLAETAEALAEVGAEHAARAARRAHDAAHDAAATLYEHDEAETARNGR